MSMRSDKKQGRNGERRNDESGSCDAPSSDNDDMPQAARTAQRELGAHITGPQDHDENREGKTRGANSRG